MRQKRGLPDGIYISFRTKTIEELITEVLFADNCALLAHTEEALQHIANRFSDTAKNFGLTISLKKIEVLYPPPPREVYSPHISVNGTNLNAVEHFIYLGRIISNEMSKRPSKRPWQSHSLRLCTKIQVH